jgi:RNA 2',3'-cyclic 3'-phosphodiesterase
MSKIRAFIAVAVGEAITNEAHIMQQTLAKTGAEVKWVEEDSMHVTLVFLGDVRTNDLSYLCRAIAKAAKNEAPFPLSIRGLGAFPTPRRPKILWAGIEQGAENLIRLHVAIEAELEDLEGYRPEERGYNPHLTLGRVSGEENAQLIAAEISKLQHWNGGQTIVEEVLLMSSELRRSGPEYTVIGRAALGGKSEA